MTQCRITQRTSNSNWIKHNNIDASLQPVWCSTLSMVSSLAKWSVRRRHGLLYLLLQLLRRRVVKHDAAGIP